MKLKKILSCILAGLMTVTAASLTVNAQESEAESSESPDELVIHYSKIQKGNVDRKEKAVINGAFEDSEMGSVVKVSPIPDTAESGAVVVDGYGIGNLKIDITKYNYITMEYKFCSDNAEAIKPYINFMPNGGVLAKTASVHSNNTLEKDKWAVLSFNMGSVVKPLVNDGMQYINQIHFYPFANLSPSQFSENDYILVRNLTFSVKNPNGDVYYNASFDGGDKTAAGTAPTPIKARFDDEIVLPEIPFTNGDKTAAGWLPDAGLKIYAPGDVYKMPERDITFTVIWEEEFKAKSLVELQFPVYCNGICDNKDTATLNTIEYEGYSVKEVIPNPASTAGTSINLDGWSYAGANINVDAYSTILVLYKYVSDNPVSGKPNLNIMKQKAFSKATAMTARENITVNRWAIASFDLTSARANTLNGIEPIIGQMHFYPLGGNKVTGMSVDDRIYVAKMYIIPDVTKSAAVHESFITGYSDGTFGIGGNMTRAEACTIVARLTAGSDAAVPANLTTAFTDVPADQWYHKYISYVESLGFLKSYSGTFLPNQNITRAEFVELVYNMGLLTDAGKNGVFTDVAADHPRAAVISAAGKAGLVNGYANGDGTFSFKPDATITRAEVVKVINNAYGKAPSADGIFEAAKNKFTDVTPDHWAYADILDAATGHISVTDESGKEKWIGYTGAFAVAEDFAPDYEAGKTKLAEAYALMDKRIEEIRSNPNTKFEVKGTTYYVSASGNDANDGKSEAAPLATAAKAASLAKAGDLVLFKRGDMWRERWIAKTGVTYSAYGEGEKPVFNGNLYGNVADEALWTLAEGTTNIWKFAKTTADIGNIVINDGEKTIEKIVPSVKDGLLYVNSAPFDVKTSFEKNEHFINIYDTISPGNCNIDSGAALYVRCDEGNPGKVYKSIELCERGHLIKVSDNCTFDNIKILYAGSHGFSMGTVKNVRFQNLEIGYIGGAAQYYKSGAMVRFGNGIEVYGGCDGFYIDNCYVYQCYDAGITHQHSSGGMNDCTEQNVFFTNNVIDKCIYNIEYFMGSGDKETVVRLMKNIEYSGNILARSGYGWGMSPGRSASIKGWNHFNRSENFVIKNNTFILDKVNACDLGASLAAWLPEYEGNTYIQKYGNSFTRVGVQYEFKGSAADDLENTVGETGFSLYYLPADFEVQ